jgi:hypothetical protein
LLAIWCIVAVLTPPQLYVCPSASADELGNIAWQEHGETDAVPLNFYWSFWTTESFTCLLTLHLRCIFVRGSVQICIYTDVRLPSLCYIRLPGDPHISVYPNSLGRSQTLWLVAPETKIVLTVMVEKVGNPAGQQGQKPLAAIGWSPLDPHPYPNLSHKTTHTCFAHIYNRLTADTHHSTRTTKYRTVLKSTTHTLRHTLHYIHV